MVDFVVDFTLESLFAAEIHIPSIDAVRISLCRPAFSRLSWDAVLWSMR